MKVYEVGGAVRDRLMGLEPADRDWVVVGSTPEEMESKGFVPVGSDFPVFLHPKTHEEYALARTERKTARGYKGFAVSASPEVSLEEDLSRRDFTVNAMAIGEGGELVDPWGGRRDLGDRVLRHVSAAFAEDPVRILRAGRFSARYPDFSVAPETMELMRSMVGGGEADSLVAERVWKELSRGLMERGPARMIGVWRDCGALAIAMPGLESLFSREDPEGGQSLGDRAMRAIGRGAEEGSGLSERFAALLMGLGPEGAEAEAGRLKAPADCAGVAKAAARWGEKARSATDLGAEGLLEILEGTDALRRPERFREFLGACRLDFWAIEGNAGAEFPQAERLEAAREAAAGIDGGAVAKAAEKGKIPKAIREARLEAIGRAIGRSRAPRM